MKHGRFGLIGHPIAHSLSPALFKAGYDGRYQYDLIETEDFEEAYERFLKDYDGINVTAPFKELAVRKADILSEECRRIGAANILIKTPEGIKAHNSDYLGVRQWLCDVAEGVKSTPPTSWAPPPAARGVAHFSPPLPHHKATVLIVGLGGAGKAAAAASHNLGYNLILMNRDISKAEVMAARLGDLANGSNIIKVSPLTDFTECFREADIIIYNIPMAIPQWADLTDDDFRGITAGNDIDMMEVCRKSDSETACTCRPKVILEANYKNPSFDKALKDRMIEANPNARYVSGETWLLYQALTGYEILTGEQPDLAKMAEVI